VETVSGDRAILRFKNFQNTLLQSNKISLDCEAKLVEVNDPRFPNRIKEHQAIAVSYAHAQRDNSNTMQLLEIVETLDEGECMIKALTKLIGMIKALTKLIGTANGAISRLRNTHYPMVLSAEDRLAIKNKKICWVCKGEFEFSYRYNDTIPDDMKRYTCSVTKEQEEIGIGIGASKKAAKRDSMFALEKFPEKISRLVEDKFFNLVRNFPPDLQKRSKVLAGIILETENQDLEVICLATGTKFISGTELTLEGDVLVDLHGEMLAKRCFRDFLFTQIEECVAKGSFATEIFYFDKIKKKMLVQKGVRFHLNDKYGSLRICKKLYEGKKKKELLWTFVVQNAN
jgi:hypothetical protein